MPYVYAVVQVHGRTDADLAFSIKSGRHASNINSAYGSMSGLASPAYQKHCLTAPAGT